MKYILIVCGTCLIVMLAFPRSDLAQAQNHLQDEWLNRSTIITDDLVKDADALSLADRALLWAQLGNVWWKQDVEKARKWMKKAIEIVETSSDSERPEERQNRILAARAIFPIMVSRDKDLSTRLTAVLTADSASVDKNERRENARAIANAALSILDNPAKEEADIKRAAEIVRTALRAGLTTDEFTAIQWELRKHNTSLADSLFVDALKVAQTTQNKSLLGSLALVAFPQAKYPTFSGPVPADKLRAALLDILANGIWHSSKSPEAKIESCQLAPIVAPLMDYFYNLLPQQAGFVRVAIAECQPLLNTQQRQQVLDSVRDLPLRTIEDYLAATEKAPTLKARINYWMRAAFIATQQKDYDRAIKILESMSKDAKESLGETWDNARWDFAVGAALTHFKKGDLASMRQVITETPARLRGLVQVPVTEQLKASNYQAEALEMLNEARSSLSKTDIAAKVEAYIRLTRLYTTLLPNESPAVFHEAVKEINRIESAKAKTGQPMWRPLSLPTSLLEADEQSVRYSLSYIDSPIIRVGLRFGLLSETLERYSTNKPPRSTENPEKKRKVNE